MLDQEKLERRLDRQFEKATKVCKKKMEKFNRKGDKDKVNALWKEYISLAEVYYAGELNFAYFKFDEKGECSFEGMIPEKRCRSEEEYILGN